MSTEKYSWNYGPNPRKVAGTRDPTSSTGFRNLDGEEMRDPAKLSNWEKAYIYGVPAAMTAGGALGAFPAAGATTAASSAATTAAPAVNWAAAPSTSHLFAPTALVGTAAPASTAASTGAGIGMSFGLGSLAKFFNSRGGEAVVNAGANLVGGRMQANAANHASDVQAQAGRDALAFEQQQYARAQAEYDAWLHGGPMARLDELIAAGRGSAAPAVNTAVPVGGPSMSLAQMRSAGSGQTPGAQQPGMVSVLAPDRSTVRQFAAGDPKLTGHLQRGWTKV